jgi:hypothetical protein
MDTKTQIEEIPSVVAQYSGMTIVHVNYYDFF